MSSDETFLFCGPSPALGFVAITHLFEREEGDGAASVWRRRLRFFPDGDAAVETVQGEVRWRFPCSRAEVECIPSDSTEEAHHAALLTRGAVVPGTLCLAYHRAFLHLLTHGPPVAGGACLVIGNGCGAFASAVLAATDLRVDGVEADAGVAALAAPVFGFHPPPHRFKLHVADGIEFLKACPPCSYDWVFVDVNSSAEEAAVTGITAPSSPFLSPSCLSSLHASLTPAGVAVFNCLPAAAAPFFSLLPRLYDAFGGCGVCVHAEDNVCVAVVKPPDDPLAPCACCAAFGPAVAAPSDDFSPTLHRTPRHPG